MNTRTPAATANKQPASAGTLGGKGRCRPSAQVCRRVGVGSEGSRLEAWMKSHKSEVAITTFICTPTRKQCRLSPVMNSVGSPLRSITHEHRPQRQTNNLPLQGHWGKRDAAGWMKCCFTSTETVGLLGTGAQDVHLDFHTAPEL